MAKTSAKYFYESIRFLPVSKYDGIHKSRRFLQCDQRYILEANQLLSVCTTVDNAYAFEDDFYRNQLSTREQRQKQKEERE